MWAKWIGWGCLFTAVSLHAQIVISEIMYHPPSDEGVEFVELWNPTDSPISLAGWRLDGGISYHFSSYLVLSPGERVVVVKDRSDFYATYGALTVYLAPHTFSGKLSNGGDTVILRDPLGRVRYQVTYFPQRPWPWLADGWGASLELKDPLLPPNDPHSWQASRRYLGTPGQPPAQDIPRIVINEVLAHTDPPLEDAVELYNAGTNTVDLSGWYLSDDPGELAKFRIPEGTILPPHGYVVFYEYQFNLNNPLVPFSFNSPVGDEAILSVLDKTGRPQWIVDAVRFGATANGVSVGRWPNGSGPLVPMRRLTFGTNVRHTDPPEYLDLFRTGHGAPNSPPLVGPVVISRLCYHPLHGRAEYVELTNISTNRVPLFDPDYPTNTWHLQGAVDYAFPTNVFLEPGERVLIAGVTPADFRRQYNLPSTIRVFGPWNGSLDNDGERLELARPDTPQTHPPNEGIVPYIVVDRVDYRPHPPWPILAGCCGAELRRIDLHSWGNDPRNWTAGTDQDQDQMPDEWEQLYGLNPQNPHDAEQDPDHDGLTNQEEWIAGTNPLRPDGAPQWIWWFRRTDATLFLWVTLRADRAYQIFKTQTLPLQKEAPWLSLPAWSFERVVQFEVPVPGDSNHFFLLETTLP